MQGIIITTYHLIFKYTERLCKLQDTNIVTTVSDKYTVLVRCGYVIAVEGTNI